MDYNFINVKKNNNIKEVILVLDFQIEQGKNVIIYIDKNNMHSDSILLEYAYYNLNNNVYELSRIDEKDRNLINNVVIELISELKNNSEK